MAFSALYDDANQIYTFRCCPSTKKVSLLLLPFLKLGSVDPQNLKTIPFISKTNKSSLRSYCSGPVSLLRTDEVGEPAWGLKSQLSTISVPVGSTKEATWSK
jgi:hypothetical protein